MVTFFQEFDQQLKTLLDKGYPQLAHLSEEEFKAQIEPLKSFLDENTANQPFTVDLETGTIPFVIVVKSETFPTEQMIGKIHFKNKPGIINMFPTQPSDFKPIPSVSIPNGLAYLLIDINRGKQTINIPPSDALLQIQNQQRSPLTIDEGLAILTHCPEFLIKNNCFSLLASRKEDKRVPALWISQNQAKLGWCWDGNPHTWLGSASCKSRLGI